MPGRFPVRGRNVSVHAMNAPASMPLNLRRSSESLLRTEGAYRLSLGDETRPYLPEIQHICTLLREAHGLVTSDEAAITLHYGNSPPPGAISVPCHFFRDAVRIEADGLHLNRAALDSLGTRLLPCGPADSWDVRTFDAIGLAFLTVSRLEERDSSQMDRYGRYPLEADFCFRHGVYGRPVADEALAALARTILGRTHPPNVTTYRVKLTHDVDRLRSYHYLLEPLRYAAGDILRRGDALHSVKRLGVYWSGEPWRSVADLLELSARFGLKSHFYFMGPTRDSHDSPYAVSMTSLLRRLSRRIVSAGHGIGFHPGFGTATDAARWGAQLAGLKDVVGKDIREGRQHMLAYSPATTPEIWDEAGMDTDYTLAYPEAPGFRNGSCRSIPAYSLVHRRTLDLRQCSTAIMEFGFFGGKYNDMDVDEALSACAPVIAACRRYAGNLVVLYHTGQTTGTVRQFYGRLLETAG